MTKLARTVHLNNPKTGQATVLLGGTELTEEQEEALRVLSDNPSLWAGEGEDDVAYKGLDAFSDGEFYFAADANSSVTPEETEKKMEEAAEENEETDDYDTWKVPRLRKEVANRQAEGEEITPEGNLKDDLVDALRTADARKG